MVLWKYIRSDNPFSPAGRVVPGTGLGRAVKRHHTLHHLKDERCWFAFTIPPIDTILGTIPLPSKGAQLENEGVSEWRLTAEDGHKEKLKWCE
ncbi:unnamed protein product [Discosporangium mesarthrocarpum]